MKRTAALLALLLAVGCSKDTPTGPSNTPPPAPSGPILVSLSGTVTAQGGTRLAGATVSFGDGPNVGRSVTTNANGDYRFDSVTQGNANLSAVAPNYEPLTRGVFVNNNTLNFTLRTLVPWSRSGTGASVFDMPTFISRVRIVGLYAGRCENFIIYIGGRLIVNEILGTCSVANSVNYDGTHLTNDGVVEVKSSSGIDWTFTEVR